MGLTTLLPYLALTRRWLWLLVLGAAIGGAAAFAYSNSQPRIYRAFGRILINQAQTNTGITSMADITTSERLARTYAQLMQERPVVDQVIADLGLRATYQQVAARIRIQPVRDTQLLTLSVEDQDPQLAADIANTVANVFIARVVQEQLGQSTSTKEVLQRQVADLERQIKVTSDAIEQLKRTVGDQPSTRLSLLQSDLGQFQTTYAQLLRSQQEMGLAEARAANSVRLVVPAVRADVPIRPNRRQDTLIGVLAGLAAMVGLAYLLEKLDTSVKTPERAEAAAGLHTLGVVALSGHASSGKVAAADNRLLFAEDLHSPVGEAFRSLRTNIEFAQVDRPGRVLLVTSAGPGEGKSTIAVNLAFVVAQAGRRVLIVDADLRRPTLHRTFGLPNDEGLTTLLVHDRPAEAAVRSTAYDGLSVLTSGPIPPNPSELLGTERLANLLKQWEEHFDVVILDSPPALTVTDAVILATRADGTVVVADAGKTSVHALARLREVLGRANANVLGIVLNKLTTQSADYHYYYARSYYTSQSKRTASDANGKDPTSLAPRDGAGTRT